VCGASERAIETLNLMSSGAGGKTPFQLSLLRQFSLYRTATLCCVWRGEG
jgi:hypothetical protein